MGKMKDFWKTMKGEELDDDLDDELFEEDTPKKAPKKEKKPEPAPKAKEKPAREPKSSQEALLNAFEYAASEAVSDDLKVALKGGAITEDLRKLLMVLVDNDKFRELLLTQAEVKKPEPKPDEYNLDPVYTDPTGAIVADEIIEAMVKTGKKLEDLGITAELNRVSKKDKKDLGPASDEEFKKYFEDLYSK